MTPGDRNAALAYYKNYIEQSLAVVFTLTFRQAVLGEPQNETEEQLVQERATRIRASLHGAKHALNSFEELLNA